MYDDLKDDYDSLKKDYDELVDDSEGRYYLTSWIACELVLGELRDNAYSQDNFDVSAEFDWYVNTYQLNDTEQAIVWAKINLMIDEWS